MCMVTKKSNSETTVQLRKAGGKVNGVFNKYRFTGENKVLKMEGDDICTTSKM